MNSEKKRRKISEELGLIYEQQDWGIINADYRRLDDFINYYFQHSSELPYIKYDLIELIVASYNDYLNGTTKNAGVEGRFAYFIKSVYDEIDLAVYNPFQYWINIANEKEFPVGRILSEIVKKYDLRR